MQPPQAFPSSLQLGTSLDEMEFTVTDPGTASTLGAIRVDATQSSHWRNIALAWRPASPYTWTAGQLNLAPNGMGFLLTAGYIGDAKVYYCPSAQSMRGDLNAKHRDGATNLNDWQTAGGFDAQTMLYGDAVAEYNERDEAGAPVSVGAAD